LEPEKRLHRPHDAQAAEAAEVESVHRGNDPATASISHGAADSALVVEELRYEVSEPAAAVAEPATVEVEEYAADFEADATTLEAEEEVEEYAADFDVEDPEEVCRAEGPDGQAGKSSAVGHDLHADGADRSTELDHGNAVSGQSDASILSAGAHVPALRASDSSTLEHDEYSSHFGPDDAQALHEGSSVQREEGLSLPLTFNESRRMELNAIALGPHAVGISWERTLERSWPLQLEMSMDQKKWTVLELPPARSVCTLVASNLLPAQQYEFRLRDPSGSDMFARTVASTLRLPPLSVTRLQASVSVNRPAAIVLQWEQPTLGPEYEAVESYELQCCYIEETVWTTPKFTTMVAPTSSYVWDAAAMGVADHVVLRFRIRPVGISGSTGCFCESSSIKLAAQNTDCILMVDEVQTTKVKLRWKRAVGSLDSESEDSFSVLQRATAHQAQPRFQSAYASSIHFTGNNGGQFHVTVSQIAITGTRHGHFCHVLKYVGGPTATRYVVRLRDLQVVTGRCAYAAMPLVTPPTFCS
jgi:hypothetical protein